MNATTRWAFALALLPIAACSTTPHAPMTPPGPPPLAMADQTFIQTAANSDAAEVQAGQLAQTKTHNPRIKAFAAKMVTDHTATTQQLSTIAQSKGVVVAATPDAMAQKMEAKLEADRPRLFDHDYLQGQIMGHREAIMAYQTEIDTGTDPDLKAFATATLPTIKQHLAMAERLAGMRHK